ncbi:uncharacterized protein LOC136037259 isoform X2 [Artemia franciscana]|uniref:uncharacterized protein LOC136037259 isoform X2 n=1 Tax=Artemia franciscana TaxID=6661 RepID=UPI0032DAA540
MNHLRDYSPKWIRRKGSDSSDDSRSSMPFSFPRISLSFNDLAPFSLDKSDSKPTVPKRKISLPKRSRSNSNLHMLWEYQPDGISAESDSITLSDNCELAATPVPEDGYIPVEGAVESVEEIDDVTINGQSNAEEVLTTVPSLLPWGGRKERVNFPTGITIDHELKSGEFIMRTLFAQFTVMVRKKIEGVMTEPLEKPLSMFATWGRPII